MISQSACAQLVAFPVRGLLCKIFSFPVSALANLRTQLPPPAAAAPNFLHILATVAMQIVCASISINTGNQKTFVSHFAVCLFR